MLHGVCGNCDSDSELSELDSDQFYNMEAGSEVSGSEVGMKG
jgi:hypothetical protein